MERFNNPTLSKITWLLTIRILPTHIQYYRCCLYMLYSSK